LKRNLLKNINKGYSFLIYIFLYLPIIVLILFSFNESKLNAVWTGFSLKWYKNLFHNYGILDAAKNSIIIAVISTILSVMLGTITAVGMYKYKFKGKTVLDSVLFVPIVIPEIVMGISMLAFFAQIKIPKGILTLVLAHVTFSVSYVFLVVKARLDGFNKSLEEAAMDLGATPLETFFKVTLPVIMPGIIAGGLLAFTLSLDDVIISFFVAGPETTTLPLKIFSMVKFGVTPEINALSTLLLLFTLGMVALMQMLNKNITNRKKLLKFSSSFLALIIIISTTVVAISKNHGEKEQINIFNWSEYLPQSVIDKFEETYNVKVNYSTFSSNEEMLAKLMAGGSQYDLVVASDYMVEVLKKQQIIQPIEKSNVPNFKNIEDSRLNLPFDEGNVYSIPYMWGDACIAVDTSKVKTEIKSLKDLWKPELKGSMVVLDDQRAIIGMTLKMLGYSINDTDSKHLEEAKQKLSELQPNIKAYDSDSPKTMLINGEATVGYVWGTEVSLAKKENPNIKAIIPSEGLFLQQDNFVIPKDSKNKKLSEQFMNFILEPEISYEISQAFPYANPNKAAKALMDEDMLKDIAVYPPDNFVKSGEYLKDIGSTSEVFDKIWSDVKK
jgi:ABC-type spermidine/putrescine transport system, permease component II